jgi:hypothetical protein
VIPALVGLLVPALPTGTTDVDYQLGGAQPDEKRIGYDFFATCTTYGPAHDAELRDRELTPTGAHGWC